MLVAAKIYTVDVRYEKPCKPLKKFRTRWNPILGLSTVGPEFAWYSSNGRNELDFSKNEFSSTKVPPANIQLCSLEGTMVSRVRCFFCRREPDPQIDILLFPRQKSIIFSSEDVVWRPVFIHIFWLTWFIVEIFLYRFPDMEFSLETRLCPISCKFSKTDFSSTESGLLRPNWSGNLQTERQNSFWLQRTNICVLRCEPRFCV